MRIAIPDDYQNAVRDLDCFSLLDGNEIVVYHDTVKSVDELSVRFADAEALVLIRERTAVTRALLERLPKLKLISQTGKGTSHIDLEACRDHGVTVCVGTGSPVAPAELTWALVMASMRNIPDEVSRMKRGEWQGSVGRVLKGRTLGVWGYGKIGSLVAGFGRAFGMRVLAFSREGSQARALKDGFDIALTAEELFASSDVLALHLRLTNETRGIVTAELLGRMKKTALLVNTSRAELIVDGALVAALELGRPHFAAVDVYEEEPVTDPAHPLLQLPGAICTPHLGYAEKESYELYFGQAFEAVNAFAAGKPVRTVTVA